MACARGWFPGGAWWSQSYHHGDPMTALGLPFRTIGIPTEFGPMPAWLVPASGHVPSAGTWAILVHGRGGTREECLRALPVLHRLGMTSLVVSYRNDPGAPPSPRGRYLLGDAEWADVEDAVIHALRSGLVRRFRRRCVRRFRCGLGGGLRRWFVGRLRRGVAEALDGLARRRPVAHVEAADLRGAPCGADGLRGGLGARAVHAEMHDDVEAVSPQAAVWVTILLLRSAVTVGMSEKMYGD